jgi:purine-binding chemotaxis protein CheW
MMTNDSIDDGFVLDADGSDGPQIVTFSLGNERFAVPMESVQEIVRVPQTVRVPLASNHLMGLANLRGRVLPIFQCRTMMGMPSAEASEASRVLVLRIGSSVGLMVDRVHAVMTISPEQIDSLAQDDDVENREWLAGVVRQEKALTLLLDVDRLVQVHATEGRASMVSSAQSHVLNEYADEESNPDELQLVSFEVAGQEYAAPIELVQEIVQAPSEFTLLPHTPTAMLGVMVLRNRLLPLVSLRAVFGLEVIALQEQHRVVVLQLPAGGAVGVVMDRVNEVLRVPKSVQEPVPALFSNTSVVNHVQSMCRLNEGKRLVSILEIESLSSFANLAMQHVDQMHTQQIASYNDPGNTETEEMDDEGQVVVFQLGGEEFGVNIHSVQEIVRVPEQLTRIPQSPAFLEGVINLRGSVLPVIDQRRRMGIEPGVQHDRQRIMVYLMNGVRTGFIVDSVTEVLRIDAKCISDTPSGGQNHAGLLPKVANLTGTKRMILLIDPSALLNSAEVAQADSAVQQSGVTTPVVQIEAQQFEEVLS